jgi:fructose-1,6-bisphosphatase/inositol monophosphatase family enzyme
MIVFCFGSAAFDLIYLAAGAVGTVEKRSLFFHRSHSPSLCLAVSFQAAVRG